MPEYPYGFAVHERISYLARRRVQYPLIRALRGPHPLRRFFLLQTRDVSQLIGLKFFEGEVYRPRPPIWNTARPETDDVRP